MLVDAVLPPPNKTKTPPKDKTIPIIFTLVIFSLSGLKSEQYIAVAMGVKAIKNSCCAAIYVLLTPANYGEGEGCSKESSNKHRFPGFPINW